MKNCLPVLCCLLVVPLVAPAQQDCISAIPITSNFYTQPNAYVGYGSYNELDSPNNGCLFSNEKNNAWYHLHILTTDSLTMLIKPNDPADDYDFAIYDITNGGCGLIYDYTADTPKAYPPVSCNYSGMSGTTGMMTDSIFTHPQFSPSLYVTAGMDLAILVSNYSASQSGYTMQFNIPAAPPAAIPAIAGQAMVMSRVSPNPVTSDNSAVMFFLPAAGRVSCFITGTPGQNIATLRNNEWMAAGKHSIAIPAGQLQLAPGVYFLQLTDGISRLVQRFTVTE